MTGPGQLNRRLLLEAAQDSADGAGGVIRSYQTVTTLWAQVTPVSLRTDVEADRLGGVARYRIVIRARNDVTIRHRFQDGARIYRIVALRDSADRRFLEIDADVRED
ncbi:MAG: phage head closure protein [Pseudolabrys sp.]|nr:phage head closure protein [Pseudolabrys sp.]